MKAGKTPLNLKEMPYQPQRKLLKREEKNITSAKIKPQFRKLL